MFAALHFPNMYSPPVGIWWFPEGDVAPHSFYIEGQDAAKISGNMSMLGVHSATQFANWTDRLAGSSSYIEGWGAAFIEPEGSPQALLAAARKLAA